MPHKEYSARMRKAQTMLKSKTFMIYFYIFICRISLVEYSDGAECIAEVGMAFVMMKTAEKLKERGFVDET